MHAAHSRWPGLTLRITEAGLRVARAEARRLEALMRAARIGGLLTKGAK